MKLFFWKLPTTPISCKSPHMFENRQHCCGSNRYFSTVPALSRKKVCHQKLRLKLLVPVRNLAEEIGRILSIHLICIFDFLMAYTSLTLSLLIRI